MGENKTSSNSFELKTSGVLAKKTVEISEQSSLDALSQRGYGTVENGILGLAFYEALYLLDKGVLEVKGEEGENTNFQTLLQLYE